MTNRVGLLLLALALAAAGPPGTSRDKVQLPIPPVPPAYGPPDRAAPIPDDVSPPVDRDTGVHAELSPAWLSPAHLGRSEGFVPGSQVDAKPDGRNPLYPGVTVRLPLR